MNDTPNQTSKRPLLRTLAGAAVLVLLGIGITFYGNRVVDWVTASRYVPTASVSSIRTNTKLTSEGATLLYASAPQIQSGQTFNESCQSSERTQAILGCYHARKIYLYDITNPELAGAKEVTAAHEMLHAAYERLNIFERPHIDALLEEQYQQVKDDAELQQLIEYYEKEEPDAVLNELHSILGTTQSKLSPELERYYARYFTDRQTIVTLNEQYSAVFDAINQRSEQIAAQIAALKPQVEAELSEYQAELDQLNTDIAAFNQKAAAGTYGTAAAFNTARQALLARVNNLNARRTGINTSVSQYNALVTEQETLSIRVEQLNSSINAAPAAGGV